MRRSSMNRCDPERPQPFLEAGSRAEAQKLAQDAADEPAGRGGGDVRAAAPKSVEEAAGLLALRLIDGELVDPSLGEIEELGEAHDICDVAPANCPEAGPWKVNEGRRRRSTVIRQARGLRGGGKASVRCCADGGHDPRGHAGGGLLRRPIERPRTALGGRQRRTEQVVPAFTQLAAVADRDLLFDQGSGIGAGPDTARARTMAGSLSGAPAGEAPCRKRPVTGVELAHWPSLRPEKVRD